MAENKNVKITEATVEGTKDGKTVLLEDSTVEGVADKIPQQSVAPTTTEQEDKTTAGQRQINLIWEWTQAIIAVSVILANMVAALFNVFQNRDVDVPLILSSSLFLIVGFYFSRTNHQAIGGVGKKANEKQEYTGR